MKSMRRLPAGVPSAWRPAILLLLAMLPALGGCRFETVEEENIEESIETMVRRSADAWNAGDLDAFMASFADGASTSYLTPDGPVYGRADIRAHYAPRFAAGATRDSLHFEDLTVRPLPPLIAIVTGRYVMRRGGAEASSGWFTVVVRRAGEGWRIVHDHSS